MSSSKRQQRKLIGIFVNIWSFAEVYPEFCHKTLHREVVSYLRAVSRFRVEQAEEFDKVQFFLQ